MTRLASCALIVVVLIAPSSLESQSLTLSPQTIMFPSSDPDVVPVVSATPVQVHYVIPPRGRGRAQAWSITILATGDLTAGPARIPITNITWVATPAPPFRNGTMSSTLPQTLASGADTGRGSGSVTFRLANSWNYSAGNYTQTVVFTLSSP